MNITWKVTSLQKQDIGNLKDVAVFAGFTATATEGDKTASVSYSVNLLEPDAKSFTSLEQTTDRESLNAYLQQMALSSALHRQIDFSASTELVSSDMVGSRFAGIVDSQATIAEGDHCVLYVWYDNEFGYSCQVVRVMEQMAGAVRQDLPV